MIIYQYINIHIYNKSFPIRKSELRILVIFYVELGYLKKNMNIK